jgi:hypothetical protein
MESTVHQVVSASIAAIFSISMLLAAHFFTEYRLSRTPAIATMQSHAGTMLVRPRRPIEAI